jgi:hypothetical protein
MKPKTRYIKGIKMNNQMGNSGTGVGPKKSGTKMNGLNARLKIK